MKTTFTSSAAALAILAAASPSAAQSDRLPTDVTPRAYRLDLTVVPDRERLAGHVEIDVDLKKPAKTIALHGRGLAVTRVTARRGTIIVSGRFSQISASGKAEVALDRPLPAGRVVLRFDYSAPFGTGANGAYRTQISGEWYVWSHFEAIDARSAYPSFDEPRFKTPFTLTLRTSPNDVAVSNTPEAGRSTRAGLAIHRFSTTAPLPTYLFAFDVGPFATAATSVPPNRYRSEPLPLRVVATKPNADKLSFVAQNSGAIMSLLESYFGRGFPFGKLDQVASPVMQGGMENAGASLFGDQFLLVTDASTNGRKHMFGDVVAHETAHQWFGDLVTPAWWDDIWLNESFANWMGHKISDMWRPDLTQGVGDAEEGFGAMDTDALSVGRPVRGQVDNDGDIEDSFDEITYGKGGQVIAMFASYLGEERFREGVRHYLDKHAYGSATSEDFYRSLAASAGDARIVSSLKSFTEQQGVPVLAVERRGGSIILTQHAYTAIGGTPTKRRWQIPACLSIGGAKQCIIVAGTPVTLPDTGGLVLPNVAGAGYYRFSLPEDDWKRLLEEAPGLPPAEAVAVLDSLWAGFRAGDVTARLLIDAARAFSKNPYAGVALDSTRRLIALCRLGVMEDQDAPSLRRFIGELFRARLDGLGTNLTSGAYNDEGPGRRSMRSGIVDMLAFDGDDVTLRRKLSVAAQAYLSGDEKALDAAFTYAGLRAYLLDQGTSAEEDMYHRAILTTDARLRDLILQALGASGRLDVGERVADHVATGDLRTVERVQLVQGLISNLSTRPTGINLLLSRFDMLLKDGTGPGSRMLLEAPSQFCSVEQADLVYRELQPFAKKKGLGTLPLERAVARAKECAALAKARRNDLRAALPN